MSIGLELIESAVRAAADTAQQDNGTLTIVDNRTTRPTLFQFATAQSVLPIFARSGLVPAISA